MARRDLRVHFLSALLGILVALAAPAAATQTGHDGHAHDHSGPATAGAPSPREPWSERTLELFASVPVQDGGRVKPLSTLADFKLLKFNGKRKCKTPEPDAERLTPIAWMLDCLFYPELADTYEVFLVRNRDALIAVGLNVGDKKKSDRYSFLELAPARSKLFEQAHTISRKEAKDRSAMEQQILIVANNLSEYEQLAHMLDFARHRFPVDGSEGLRELFGDESRPGIAPVLERTSGLVDLWSRLEQMPPERREPEAAASQELMRQLDYFVEIGGGGLALFAPTVGAEERAAWLSPVELLRHGFEGDLPIGRKVELLGVLEELEATKSDRAVFEEKLGVLHAGLADLAEARGEYWKIPLEITFYRWDFFYRALVLFLLAFLMVAISWLGVSGRWLQAGIWLTLGSGAALSVAGIWMRCVIRSRPPVSTLYETILFIAACAVLVAMVIEWINRQRIALAVATVLGTLGMFLSMKYELKEAVTAGDTMGSLVAVLDTNFWLATHVTTVTLGYAAGLLAAAIAHIWIFGKLFGLRRGDKPFYKTIARMVYGVVCFGLLFSVVGTILGGIWANYSWGRFWGWDPKENGALLICLMELLILHSRMGGYIKDHGLAVMAVLNGIVVAFSWWGVNLLGVGLHSYGFTSGVALILWIFYLVELAVVLLAGATWLMARNQAKLPAGDSGDWSGGAV